MRGQLFFWVRVIHDREEAILSKQLQQLDFQPQLLPTLYVANVAFKSHII